MKFLFFLLWIPSLLIANPWGKDADLAKDQVKSASHCRTGPIQALGVALIRFHQEVISPVDGPRSHFTPSSSQYTLEAIRKYGFLTGVMMGCDRLMRENSEPGFYEVVEVGGRPLKLNPVP